MRQKNSWSSASNSCKYQRLLFYCANNQICLQTFETMQQFSHLHCTKYLFNSAVDFLSSPATQSEANGQQSAQEVFFPSVLLKPERKRTPCLPRSEETFEDLLHLSSGDFQRAVQKSKERGETLKVAISIFKAPMPPHYDGKPPAIAFCVAQTLEANCLGAER